MTGEAVLGSDSEANSTMSNSGSELDEKHIAKLRGEMLKSCQKADELNVVSSTKCNRNFNDIFTLLKYIGHGSFAHVYKCRDNVTEVYHTAKVISLTDYVVKGGADVSKEIRICERLNAHPNMLHLIEHFSEPERNVLIFEYIKGSNLYYDICTKKRYTAVDASHYMRQIMEGVHFCHSLGIVHRDIKLSNILVSTDQTVKLTDFGLSVEIGDKPKAWHGWAGTPLFLSPEIVRFQEYGTPVDMWACGVVLYMMLLGVHPLDKIYRAEKVTLYRKIAEGKFKIPKDEKQEYLSDEEQDLLSRLLTVDQDERMTAEEALKHPFLTNAESVATTFHRKITVVRMRRLSLMRFSEGVSVFSTIFPSKGLRDRVNAAQFGYRHGDARVSLSIDAVRVIGFKRRPNDDHETAAKRSRILQLTKWIIKAVVEFDYSTYRDLVSDDRSCSGFDTDETWKFGLEFKEFHEDREVIDPDVIRTGITIVKPCVQLHADVACIAYNKILQIVNRGKEVVFRCVQETRVWERVNDLDHWRMVHIHNSRYPCNLSDLLDFGI